MMLKLAQKAKEVAALKKRASTGVTASQAGQVPLPAAGQFQHQPRPPPRMPSKAFQKVGRASAAVPKGPAVKPAPPPLPRKAFPPSRPPPPPLPSGPTKESETPAID